MNKFHSTMSRRDFMKGIGLVGAGIGAAGAASPLLRDMDELTSSTRALRNYPWFVKERDFEDPAFKIDWALIQRMDQRITNAQSWRRSTEPDAIYNVEHKSEILKDYIQKKYPDWEPIVSSKSGEMVASMGLLGRTTRDIAFGAATAISRGGWLNYMYAAREKNDWTGIQAAATPEQLGIPKWNGTPEENTRMVRAFARYVGASDVGVSELTPNMKKFFLKYDGSGKTYEFEDVDYGYVDDEKFVTPNKCKWVITWTHAEPTELALRVPSAHGGSSTHISYSTMPMKSVQIQEFIRALGYQGLSSYQSYNYGVGPASAFGYMAGIGEHARMCFVVISPNEGSSLRGMNRIITDLPLAPTKPIDYGVYRFCETCKICAEHGCPFHALPTDGPSWEADFYQPTGFEGYRLITRLCTFCMACQAVCPFTELHGSWIHQLIKTTTANTTLFNGFFANMETTFGYGFKDPESWWDNMDDEPVNGLHPTYL